MADWQNGKNWPLDPLVKCKWIWRPRLTRSRTETVISPKKCHESLIATTVLLAISSEISYWICVKSRVCSHHFPIDYSSSLLITAELDIREIEPPVLLVVLTQTDPSSRWWSKTTGTTWTFPHSSAANRGGRTCFSAKCRIMRLF